MGGFLKHFGFALPLSIVVDGVAGDPTKPPRDRLPVAGPCSLCRRERAVCYIKGKAGSLVCRLCIDDHFKMRKVKNASPQRRSVDPRPEGLLPEGVTDEFDKRRAQWDRWLD